MIARIGRALLLAIVAASVPANLLGRSRPGVGLASGLALGVAWWAPRLFRRAGLDVNGALEIIWLLPFAACWGLGEGLSLFERIHWWDHLAHALGGIMAFALFRAWALPRLRTNGPALVALSVLMALAVGAAWEMGEFASDTWLRTATQSGNTDTMLDLVWDAIGGALGATATAFAPALRSLAGSAKHALLCTYGHGD